MLATTKRKNAVRCTAAASDSSSDSGSVLKDDARKKRSTGSREVTAKATTDAGSAKKRRKEFAWMDSDDEESDQKDDPESGDDAVKGKKEESEDEEAVSVEALDQVHSFGRMMLLAPSVSRRLRGGDLSHAEVAATCRALARVKFFDRDLLDDLFEVLRSMLSGNKLSIQQTSDAVRLLTTLNAYSRDVCSAIARCFSSRTGEMDVATRTEWLESFKAFKHQLEPEFLQLLEVPPVPPMHPNYRRVRCFHFSRGSCVLSRACTYSHDQHAPLSLSDGTKEDWWKCKSSIMMTQNQKNMGQGSYGTGPLGVNPL